MQHLQLFSPMPPWPLSRWHFRRWYCKQPLSFQPASFSMKWHAGLELRSLASTFVNSYKAPRNTEDIDWTLSWQDSIWDSNAIHRDGAHREGMMNKGEGSSEVHWGLASLGPCLLFMTLPWLIGCPLNYLLCFLINHRP